MVFLAYLPESSNLLCNKDLYFYMDAIPVDDAVFQNLNDLYPILWPLLGKYHRNYIFLKQNILMVVFEVKLLSSHIQSITLYYQELVLVTRKGRYVKVRNQFIKKQALNLKCFVIQMVHFRISTVIQLK